VCLLRGTDWVFIFTLVFVFKGRVMAQAVSREPFRAETVVRSFVELVVDKSALRQVFLLALSIFPVSIIPPMFQLYIYIALSSGER
jgi:hypothetical protein